MKIGLVGVGVVGNAVKYGFKVKRGHDVTVYDIKLEGTSLENVYRNSEMIFLCVSTPQDPSGACDVSNVEQICRDINKIAESKNEKKDVIIKSTIEPGTTNMLAKKFQSIRFAMNPEFLLERAAVHNFCHQDICIIGTEYDDLYEKIVEVHGNLAQEYIKTASVNAELVKYYCNVFNSARIIFANLFYDIAQKVGANYDETKRIAVKRENMIDSYLDCNENLRGFRGACLPKDTSALFSLTSKLGIDYKFLRGILDDNERLLHDKK